MFIKLYLIALPVFFIIDMVWLGLIARGFYRGQIGFLMREGIHWPAAILFYLIFLAGLVFFAVLPAVQKQSWVQAGYLGALYGLFTYATYELTNLATLQGWPLILTLVDTIWGIVLASLVSVVTYMLNWKV